MCSSNVLLEPNRYLGDIDYAVGDVTKINVQNGALDYAPECRRVIVIVRGPVKNIVGVDHVVYSLGCMSRLRVSQN